MGKAHTRAPSITLSSKPRHSPRRHRESMSSNLIGPTKEFYPKWIYIPSPARENARVLHRFLKGCGLTPEELVGLARRDREGVENSSPTS